MRTVAARLMSGKPVISFTSEHWQTRAETSPPFMNNWGGDEWVRWHTRLRDDLIARQEIQGPAKGSWKPRTGAIHAKQGGRLLTTALAMLTLEVYYRYKPLLPEEVVGEVVNSN